MNLIYTLFNNYKNKKWWKKLYRLNTSSFSEVKLYFLSKHRRRRKGYYSHKNQASICLYHPNKIILKSGSLSITIYPFLSLIPYYILPNSHHMYFNQIILNSIPFFINCLFNIQTCALENLLILIQNKIISGLRTCVCNSVGTQHLWCQLI